VQGECFINTFYPNGTMAIYDTPLNYTLSFSCDHEIESTYALRLTLPDEFHLWDTTRCVVGDVETGEEITPNYSCTANSDDMTIVIEDYVDSTLAGNTDFEISISSIRNPGTFDIDATLGIESLSSANAVGAVDLGQKDLKDTMSFVNTTIDAFTVVAESTAVGNFPTSYTFTVQPRGEIDKDSYLIVKFPNEIIIHDSDKLEKSCGTPLVDFTNYRVACRVTGQEVKITKGFDYAGTTNMTDISDGSIAPPIIEFTIPYLRNPRTSVDATGAFNVTIYNNANEITYLWNSTDSPTVSMSGAS